MDGDGPRLADAVRAVLRLPVDLRVEVDVVQDHRVRPYQIQPLPASARGEQKREDGAVRVVELIHQRLPA